MTVAAVVLCRVRCWPLGSTLDRSISSGISYFMYMHIEEHHVVRDRQFCSCSSAGLDGQVGGWMAATREKRSKSISDSCERRRYTSTQQRAVHNIHIKR